MGKSKLVPVGAVTNVEILATILGSKVSSFPMNYLGFPLGSRFKDMSMCYILEKKIERRLSSWKRMYLSKGGRVILATSMLSSLPTYYLSLFLILRG